MQPSQFEIQREVENLRDIRRRSSAGGPGALVLDPDLPNQAALGAAQLNYWDPSQTASSSSSSAEESSSSADDHDDGSDTGDPSSLFWVPARLHPEIAPAEFRAFIKEHARTPADASTPLDRSFSTSSGGLGRKKSMLNREYKPREGDGVENERNVVPLRRNRSSYYSPGPQLSINDLQKLDELAEEASQSDDPSKLRSVLRRSLSFNMSPSVIDQMDMPDLGDEADTPIIVPKPGQILRRSARTKIRKPGQTGEGAHRFQSRSRRPSGPRSNSIDGHSDQEPQLPSFDPNPSFDFGEPQITQIGAPRPESFSDETFIYDAYADENLADPVPVFVSQPPPDEKSTSPPPIIEFEPQPLSSMQPHEIPIPPTPTLHHPQPHHHLAPTTEPQQPSRTPSPDASSITLVEAPHRAPEPYHSASTSSLPQSNDRKEKGKKSGFFGWGGEKGKKGSKEKEKEKDSSFLGSLFGGSKKKQEEYAGTGLGSGSGRETAAALLGASKSSKSRAPSPTPQAGGPYARYPIHVERAIYRLSHIKLANPRRPLYEQVLISNLMFWYLGVINNKGQTNGTGQDQNQTKEPQQQQGTGQQPQGGQEANSNLEKEKKEQEEREKAERERIEQEKEREREREREKELLAQQQQQGQRREQKRGPLTKPAPGPPGQRRAEMPVRAPQYDMQQRMMEQEYGGYDPRNPPNRQGSIPTYNPGPQLVQPQPQTANNVMYYTPDNSPGPNGPSQRPPPQLPPGAMPPMNDQWKNQGGPRRPRSPPQMPYGQNPTLEKAGPQGRLPSRSLSTGASQPQMGGNPGFQHQPNGKIKKGTSAHAVLNPSQRVDEDSPLAMWQQQQRRK